MVTVNDDEWKVVMRRARTPSDMRPTFLPKHSCNQSNCLAIVERAGNPVTCINEVTQGQSKWEKITVTIDSGAVDSVGPPTMAKSVKSKTLQRQGRE